MKYYLLPATFLLLIFNSCKKQTDNNPTKTSNNTITANVNGANVTFNVQASAYIKTNEPGQYPYVLGVTGETDTSGSRAIIVVSVSSENAIATGVFPSADTSPEPATFSQIIFSQATPGSQITQDYITNNFAQGSTTVTITSLSNTRVQGTFSGALVYSITGTGTPGKTIANGTFDLAID